MVQGHEGCVDDDTECYEEIHKGVEDDDGEELSQADVAVAAVPHAHHIHALDAELTDPLLQSEMLQCYSFHYFRVVRPTGHVGWADTIGG